MKRGRARGAPNPNLEIRPGDLIRHGFYQGDPGEVSLVLEVLDPDENWCKGLGRYPDYVLRVITATGDIGICDFFNYPGEEPELEIIRRA